jgi:phage/plasmid primase-like uncharacterized protein
MRGTVAKRLRRKAEALSVGKPWVVYKDEAKQRKAVPALDAHGRMQGMKWVEFTGTRKLERGCTRATYKWLRQVYRHSPQAV